MNIKKLKTDRGFTIVELLIVIVVIAILAAITIVAFNGVQQRARDAERASDVAAIAKALSAYIADGNTVPNDAEDAKTALGSYPTVKVDSTVLDKLGSTASSSGSQTTYGYTTCETGTPEATTGATISWEKEAGDGTESLDAGSC